VRFARKLPFGGGYRGRTNPNHKKYFPHSISNLSFLINLNKKTNLHPMAKIWKFIPQPNQSEIENLQNELNIPLHFAKILTQRGIQSFDEAKSFFRPIWEDTHDPFLMKNMGLAIERLNQAIKRNEKITPHCSKSTLNFI
jgi:hypothetical protein